MSLKQKDPGYHACSDAKERTGMWNVTDCKVNKAGHTSIIVLWVYRIASRSLWSCSFRGFELLVEAPRALLNE